MSKLIEEHLADDRETTSQTVTMIEAEKFYSVSVPSNLDPTFHQGHQANSDLGEFLSRPLKIGVIDWSVGSAFNRDFYPWEQYFSNTAVQNKLNNYFLMSCDLVVRIQVNASPFHYGRLLASYEPLALYDGVDYNTNGSGPSTAFDAALNRPATPAGNIGQFLVGYSQRPHVTIDASTNQSGELRMPFFYPRNNLRVTNRDDFRRMGRLSIDSFTPLKHATQGTNNVTIVVWAYATNVRLSIPTTQPVFTPQSDEYEAKGVVSKPAAIVSNVAGMLVDAPVIGPFAMATQMAAGAVSNIASIFGFSRPMVIDKPCLMRPKPLATMSNVDTEDVGDRITLNAKQELTVDSRTVGLDGTDEMQIKNIVQRESYFTTFQWRIDDSHETCLFACMVTPRVEAEQLIAGPPGRQFYTPTAISWASQPFRHWSGTLKYRFSFVCSRFHRGRVRIVYDPFNVAVANDNIQNYNLAFSQVLDLAATRDITIEIPWAQPNGYARCDLTSGQSANTFRPNWTNQEPAGRPDASWRSTAAGYRSWSNGILAVYVLNELNAPDPNVTDPVYVLASISAGDDFELTNPTQETIRNNKAFEPQSDELFYPQADVLDAGEHDQRNLEENAPTQNMALSISETPMSMVDMKRKVYFGETITSFRSLLKRYAMVAAHTLDQGTGVSAEFGIYVLRKPVLPFYAGQDPNGRFGANLDNAVYTSLFTWLMRGYAGWRGSIRKKYAISEVDVNAIFEGGRDPSASTYSVDFNQTQPTGYTNSTLQVCQQVRNTSFKGFEGFALTMQQTNAGLEYELPFYRNARFGLARLTNVKDGTGSDDSNLEGERLYVSHLTGDARRMYIKEFHSIGEDFSMFFFISAPSYWRDD